MSYLLVFSLHMFVPALLLLSLDSLLTIISMVAGEPNCLTGDVFRSSDTYYYSQLALITLIIMHLLGCMYESVWNSTFSSFSILLVRSRATFLCFLVHMSWEVSFGHGRNEWVMKTQVVLSLPWSSLLTRSNSNCIRMWYFLLGKWMNEWVFLVFPIFGTSQENHTGSFWFQAFSFLFCFVVLK